MELKDLKPAEGSRKNRKRVGRGHAAGQGKTAGRGMNGQKSRSGGGKGAGFEGGQTPLARRLPKLPGFRNINRVEYLPVNVSRLEEKFEAGDVVDGASLKAKGIIKHEDAERQFSFSKGLFGPAATSVDAIGIGFAGGKTLGDKANVKLRFDPSFMQMAADGKL